MSKVVSRLLNVGLRSATLGTRFLFIFFLARYLDPAAVGYYGLFTAAVGYSLYFVGLDFYTWTTREILKTPLAERGRLLKSQMALAGLLYLALLPVGLLFLHQVAWPYGLALWFFPLLVLEHLNQEISRLLMALSEQISASVILFIRQGSWALAIVVLMSVDSASRQLSMVMALWTAAGLVAAAIGVWKLQRLHMGGWHSKPDWNWVWQGVRVSAVFLLATLALRGVQTIDRYWLEALGGIEQVGAYVLMFGVAGTLMVFLDAGVFAYAYPALITLHQNRQFAESRARVRQMLRQTLTFCGGFAVISWILLPWLLRWIGNPVYSASINLYPWLLLAMIVNAAGMVPHYALYGRGCDKPIIFSHIAALLCFVLATWLLSVHIAGLAVPVGLCIAFMVILVWKSVAYLRLIKHDPSPQATRKTA